MSDPTAPAPLLEADCILKRRGRRVVLTSASVRARPGRMIGLLGRNGAGKSTLLRVLVGLERFDGGTVRVDGVGHDRVHLAALARQGAFFLPDRDLLHPLRPIDEQLAWIAQAADLLERRRPPAPIEPRVAEMLTRLGIAHVRHQDPRKLPGGERRRAEVACALLRAPRVLVLDEPLRGIAPLDAEAILGALRGYVRAGGAAVITGHELPLLMSSLDGITWCHATRTREFASVEDAMRDEGFRAEFLGSAHRQ